MQAIGGRRRRGGVGGGGGEGREREGGEEGTRQPRWVGDERAGCRRMGFTVRSPRQAGVGGLLLVFY